MFCTSCGSKIDEGSKFCQKCGEKLAENQPSANSKSEDNVITDNK